MPLKRAGTLHEEGLYSMSGPRRYTVMTGYLVVLSALTLLTAAPGFAEEVDCVSCHQDLTAGKSVHQAVSMGCAVCHSAVDASDVPHMITNRNPKGLASKMRDLCYSCHDKKPFMKITVHGALRLGCTTCHDPHASKHARLLKEDTPRLCLNCHQERLMADKSKTHDLKGGADCSNCHNPHSTDTPKLFLSGVPGVPSERTTLVLAPSAARQ